MAALRWSLHLRGHVLSFDSTPAATPSRAVGVRLLVAAAAVEVLRLFVVRSFYPSVPLWVLRPLLLALALFALRWIGVNRSQLGLRPWREWTTTEKSYFWQAVVIGNVVFAIVLGRPLRDRLTEPGTPSALWTVFFPYLVFGFYQEVVYRGMVQPELVRRWRAWIGILAASLLYTFGPLHWNYLDSRPSLAVPMCASIFAVGMFFGALYWRSGNLWIVAVLHAIGNAYMVTALGHDSSSRFEQ